MLLPGVGFTRASWVAERTMKGVPWIFSAGSNQLGTSDVCTAQVIWLSGPAPAQGAQSRALTDTSRIASTRNGPLSRLIDSSRLVTPDSSPVARHGRGTGGHLVELAGSGFGRRRVEPRGAGAELPEFRVQVIAEPVSHEVHGQHRRGHGQPGEERDPPGGGQKSPPVGNHQPPGGT